MKKLGRPILDCGYERDSLPCKENGVALVFVGIGTFKIRGLERPPAPSEKPT